MSINLRLESPDDWTYHKLIIIRRRKIFLIIGKFFAKIKRMMKTCAYYSVSSREGDFLLNIPRIQKKKSDADWGPFTCFSFYLILSARAVSSSPYQQNWLWLENFLGLILSLLLPLDVEQPGLKKLYHH